MKEPENLYTALISMYGPQGWWPVPALEGTEGYTRGGYHPGVFPSYGSLERYQIVCGAVLTQNTTWKNARYALERMMAEGVTDPRDVLTIEETRLAELIRPSGYYNQKARKLRAVTAFLMEQGTLEHGYPPGRADLLDIWGVGPETADSILLYAFDVPVFVVDAYTRRLFSRLMFKDVPRDYGGLQWYITRRIPEDVRMYQEFHALIVRHCKDVCKKRPLCAVCPFPGECGGNAGLVF